MIDKMAAYENFEKALEKGKTEANLYLGMICQSMSSQRLGGDQVFQNAAEAFYKALGDNPLAQVSLGLLYIGGNAHNATQENVAKVQELFDAAIAAGYADGYYGKGRIAEEEEGDTPAALAYYMKAAEDREQLYAVSAMVKLGGLYQKNGALEHFGSPNFVKAIEWYEKAAALGNPEAMRRIGNIYYSPGGTFKEGMVERDYAKAAEWYEKAAVLGNDEAMVILGNLYSMGYGVEKNADKEREWQDKSYSRQSELREQQDKLRERVDKAAAGNQG